MVRVPVVGIDLDGVIVEFNRVMLRKLTSFTGVEYHPHDVTNYDYSKCLEGVTPEIVAAAFSDAINRDGFWVHLPSVSQDAVDAARDLSIFTHLYAVTARSENRAVESRYQTTLNQSHCWLTTRGIMCKGVIRCDDGADKGPLLAAMNCEYFLDDQPKAFLSCMDNGVNAYLLNMPYNQDIDTDRRVYSVKEYADLIREEIQ